MEGSGVVNYPSIVVGFLLVRTMGFVPVQIDKKIGYHGLWQKIGS